MTGRRRRSRSAFCEGLFGPLHSEFERTPKTAAITTATAIGTPPAPVTAKRYPVKVHWPYVVTEMIFVAFQLTWAVLFAINGLILCALGALFVAGCVVAVAFFCGDDHGKVCFVLAKPGGRPT